MSEILGDWKRSHYCGDLSKQDIGREVCLMGWVHRRRDHGGLIFIDLRDRTGIAQLALDPDRDPQSHAKAEAVRNEFVVAAIGTELIFSREERQTLLHSVATTVARSMPRRRKAIRQPT